MNDRAKRGQCEVLRLRNLAMIENIRRAEDPAWGERLERQQVLARLGRMFGRTEDPLQALQDHVQAIKEELQTRRSAPRTEVLQRSRRGHTGAGSVTSCRSH